jgi:hypothetical protein
MLIFLIVISLKNNAQNNLILKNTYVYFTPSTLIEPKAYVRLGIGKDFKQNGLLVELGYGKKNNKIDYSRFQARILCRHYLMKNEENNLKPYVFLEVFYNQRKTIIDSGAYRIEDLIDDTNPYIDTFKHMTFDRATENVKKMGSNLGVGILTKASHHFYIDTYFGLGLAMRNVNYEDLLNPFIKNLPYQGAREWADLERFGLPKTLAVFSLKLGISFVYKMK